MSISMVLSDFSAAPWICHDMRVRDVSVYVDMKTEALKSISVSRLVTHLDGVQQDADFHLDGVEGR